MFNNVAFIYNFMCFYWFSAVVSRAFFAIAGALLLLLQLGCKLNKIYFCLQLSTHFSFVILLLCCTFPFKQSLPFAAAVAASAAVFCQHFALWLSMKIATQQQQQQQRRDVGFDGKSNCCAVVVAWNLLPVGTFYCRCLCCCYCSCC